MMKSFQVSVFISQRNDENTVMYDKDVFTVCKYDNICCVNFEISLLLNLVFLELREVYRENIWRLFSDDFFFIMFVIGAWNNI